MLIDEIKNDVKSRMQKSVETVEREFMQIRTGRASPALVETLNIEAYGSSMHLNQLATVSISDAKTIIIQPWDKSIIQNIEKGILKANIGVTPVNDGNIIRIVFPPLTEERRKELVKIVHRIAEEGRVAIRNVRRDANERLKKAEKEKIISEDDEHKAFDIIQKLTDDNIKKIDELVKSKEKEILEELD